MYILTDSMPMLSPLGAILLGGVVTMTPGIGTMAGTGMSAGEAGDSVGDGMILGITIIIILIGGIIRIIITIMVPFGLVAGTSVAVGVMASTMTIVVALPVVPMLYVATVGMITVCVLLVVMTVVRQWLRAATVRAAHQVALWQEEIQMRLYALQAVAVDSP